MREKGDLDRAESGHLPSPWGEKSVAGIGVPPPRPPWGMGAALHVRAAPLPPTIVPPLFAQTFSGASSGVAFPHLNQTKPELGWGEGALRAWRSSGSPRGRAGRAHRGRGRLSVVHREGSDGPVPPSRVPRKWLPQETPGSAEDDTAGTYSPSLPHSHSTFAKT